MKKEAKTITIRIRISPSQLTKLKDTAKQKHTTISEIVRQTLPYAGKASLPTYSFMN
jgi:hypothetical protein